MTDGNDPTMGLPWAAKPDAWIETVGGHRVAFFVLVAMPGTRMADAHDAAGRRAELAARCVNSMPGLLAACAQVVEECDQYGYAFDASLERLVAAMARARGVEGEAGS